jgi:hypothetical protein
MLVLKRREVNVGHQSVVSRLGSGTDHVFHSMFANVKNGLSYINKKTFLLLAHWLAFHVLLRIRNVYVEIKHLALQNPYGKKLIDAVRGRGEIKNHGASFYLRRISDK